MCPNPLRVTHVITSLDTGGAERALTTLAPALARHGVTSTVISVAPGGPFAEELTGAGIAVETLGVRRGVPDPRAVTRLRRFIRDTRPAVVQSWLYHADLLATVARLVGGRWKLAWNIRCSTMRLDRYSFVTRATVRSLVMLSRIPDVVVTNSHAAVAVHDAMGYRPRRWEVIPNAIDSERFRPRPEVRQESRAKLGLPQSAIAIGMIARFDPMKDHETFLRSIAILRQSDDRVVGVLIGVGYDPSNAPLMRLVRDLGLEGRVILAGQLANVERIVPALDLFALCSFGEGFPNALAEAIACGVPAVATDVGDVAQILADAGSRFPVGDASAAAAAMRYVLSRGSEVSVDARARISAEYSVDRIAARYAALYRGLDETLAGVAGAH